MPNTKAIGVAYADPQFDSVDVTGPVTAASAAVSGAVSAGSVSAADITSSNATGELVANAAGGVYFLSTAITNNVTTTAAPAGSLGLTSNATGRGILFVSDGSKWQLAAITQA